MFSLFRNKKLDEMVEKIKEEPYVEPEREYYMIGPTTEGRVLLKLYYGNVSLNKDGIDALIKVLEAAKDWCVEKSGKQSDDGCQEEEEPV